MTLLLLKGLISNFLKSEILLLKYFKKCFIFIFTEISKEYNHIDFVECI